MLNDQTRCLETRTEQTHQFEHFDIYILFAVVSCFTVKMLKTNVLKLTPTSLFIPFKKSTAICLPFTKKKREKKINTKLR